MTGRFAVGLLIPTLIYDGLRDLGVSVYLALLVSTLISAAPTVVGLFRRKLNALSAYFTTMVLGSVVVSLVAGSTEFLLAKEAVLTFVTGMWFLAGAASRRPLSYTLSRPLVEGVPVAVGLGEVVGAFPALAPDVAGVQRDVGFRHHHRRGATRADGLHAAAGRRAGPGHRPGPRDVGGAHHRHQRLLRRERRVQSGLPAVPGRS